MPEYLNPVEEQRVRILKDLMAEHGGMITGRFAINPALEAWGFKGRLGQGWRFLYEMTAPAMSLIYAHRRLITADVPDDIIHLLPNGWIWLYHQSGCWGDFRNELAHDLVSIARAVLLENQPGPDGRGLQISGRGINGVTRNLLTHIEYLRGHPDPSFRRPLINNAAQIRGLLSLAQVTHLMYVGFRGEETVVLLPEMRAPGRDRGQIMLDQQAIETAFRTMPKELQTRTGSAHVPPGTPGNVVSMVGRPRRSRTSPPHAPDKLPVRSWPSRPHLGRKARAVCTYKHVQ